MKKRLTRIGNSVGLVIDKTMRRMLALGPSRMVNVTTDGRRLVIEPIDEHEVLPRSVVFDVNRVFMRLMNVYGMGKPEFAALQTGFTSMFTYGGWIRYGVDNANASQRAAVLRIHACCVALDGGADWPAGIAEALRRVPPVAAAA